jgi:hypothetical protein
MAHANNSIIVGKLRGSLGKELVFREWDGKTIVAKSPRGRTTPGSPAQAATRERFFAATQYAKSVLKSADQSLAQAYAAALKPRQNLYSRATEDFMSLPVVKSIGTHKYKGAAADILVIRATDDFRVTNVYVEIYSAGGALLESGFAVQNLNGLDWTYTFLYANPAGSNLAGIKIKAVATDVPGNEGTLEVTL